jgi:hypothetical protein
MNAVPEDELAAWADRISGLSGVTFALLPETDPAYDALRGAIAEVTREGLVVPTEASIEIAPGKVRVSAGGDFVIADWDGSPDDLAETVADLIWSLANADS